MACAPRLAAVQSTSQFLSRFFLISVFLILSTTILAADSDSDTSLLPSAASASFPQCGLSCSNLKQAQDGCIPPKAPAYGHATYVSCFCQSGLLSQLHNSGDRTCDDSCSSPPDRSLLQKWYNDFCSSGGQSKAETASTPAQKDSATSTTTANAQAQEADPAPPSWWSSHYQWVIMVIVLIIGFSLIAVLSVWLKRRHDAKYPSLYHAAGTGSTDSGLLFNRQSNAATPSPAPGQPAPLAPGQFMPIGYANPDSAASSSRTDIAAPNRPSRTPSRLQISSQPTDEGNVEIREVTR
ncbi:uncharacterized protein ATNIH1004_010458 [Aspergillus tanneri]|nr:uncharacterized protein ATNIH1004_010458 [Aspergillus tanneri]KAA8643684.1 hypothetical protein ATNIH1004_010458 [Aspergillus tanneri]